MKLGELTTLFDDKLTALRFKKWDLPFAYDNIPANILDRSFHLTVGQISSGPAVQLVHEFRVPIMVRLFFKGYRDPLSAMSAALSETDAIYAALLKPSVRLGGKDNLKDIRPVSVQPFPIDSTNDNSIILELLFESVLQYRFT